MTLVTCISSLTFLFFVKDKHGVFPVVPDTFFLLEAIQKTGGFSSVRHIIHWTRGLFLFVSMTLFGFFAGDTHLLRTIAALRDEDVVINPRTRSKSGLFVKAPVWKPVSFSRCRRISSHECWWSWTLSKSGTTLMAACGVSTSTKALLLVLNSACFLPIIGEYFGTKFVRRHFHGAVQH